MNASFLEFEISDSARLEILMKVFAALQQAKKSGVFQGEAYWLDFFDETARSYFWWPTEMEIHDWKRRWDATPVSRRSTNESLKTPWLFGSMIDAIHNGEYELVRCIPISEGVGRLLFQPLADPFGGTDALRILIESFGFRVIKESGT
jgi:hypothetical protein